MQNLNFGIASTVLPVEAVDALPLFDNILYLCASSRLYSYGGNGSGRPRAQVSFYLARTVESEFQM